jgi:hypothetical protein
MQRLQIELYLRSYNLNFLNLPRQPAYLWLILPPPTFRIRSVRCSAVSLILSLSCRLSSVTATLAEIGPSRHRSAQIKAYSACHRLHAARELTKILPLTRNTTAQPGRSWLCRREALLSLARSYRIKRIRWRCMIASMLIRSAKC